MKKAFLAGGAYFAIVFAAGFALGFIRVGIIAPMTSDLIATLIELPVILAISWLACGFCLKRFGVERRAGARLLMGAAAFALLILAEIALGLTLLNRTLAGQVEAMSAPAALAGLAGQILFAFFPLMALGRR
ncbi:MAG: hypothetical protein U5J99_12700 [Parvularculaceae bacterium]|nr:hypothetical protein [Parvularculaceae bacterium]